MTMNQMILYSFLFFVSMILLNVLTDIYHYQRKKKLGLFEIDQMKGIEFEKYTVFLLKEQGFSKIKMTPASGDYGIDVIATNPKGERIGIQCKRWKKNVGIKAVQEAYSGKSYYGLDRAYVLTNSYFTNAAIETAKRNGIGLWDRDILVKNIKRVQKEQKKVASEEN